MPEIGFEWILILLRRRSFEEDDREDPELTMEFQNHRPYLKGEQLQAVVAKFERLRDEEEKRKDGLETKTFSLIGLTSVAGAFVAGFAQLTLSDKHPTLVILLTLIYVIIGASFLATIELARRAIQVGKYKYMEPRLSSLWGATDENRDEIYRDHAAVLLRSYLYNRGLINDKATYVMAAQDWFRNTICLLFLLPIVFGILSLIWPSQSSTGISVPTPTIVITETYTPSPTIVPPTETHTPTPTLTPVGTTTLTTPIQASATP